MESKNQEGTRVAYSFVAGPKVYRAVAVAFAGCISRNFRSQPLKLPAALLLMFNRNPFSMFKRNKEKLMRRLLVLFCAVLICCLPVAMLNAQSAATITGQVVDPQGAVITS